jgi:hypothetical protein
MERRRQRQIIERIARLGLAAFLLVNTGCILAAAGAAAAGGAAIGYLYVNGTLYRDYPAGLADTTAAVRASLLELKFEEVKETPGTTEAVFMTKTADGHNVRVDLALLPNPIPAEAPTTRISVRVGFSGDEAVSGRILDQVSKHIPPAPVATPDASGRIAPQPQTTPPPPLAPTPVAAPTKG